MLILLPIRSCFKEKKKQARSYTVWKRFSMKTKKLTVDRIWFGKCKVNVSQCQKEKKNPPLSLKVMPNVKIILHTSAPLGQFIVCDPSVLGC